MVRENKQGRVRKREKEMIKEVISWYCVTITESHLKYTEIKEKRTLELTYDGIHGTSNGTH